MLQREKIKQAIEILNELNIDMWITLTRESGQNGDPVLPYISAVQYTWLSAIIVTKQGKSIALVGNFDVEGTRQTGIYDEVLGYEKSFDEVFVNLINTLDPLNIALNYSLVDPSCDGLSHGLYMYIKRILEQYDMDITLLSSSGLISRLRGRKTSEEIERINGAIAQAEDIFQASRSFIKQGISEIEIWRFFDGKINENGVAPAWQAAQCPGTMVGSRSIPGHNAPTDIKVAKGDSITIDFGVKKADYCSDLQRVYYVLRDGETEADPEVQKAFEVVSEAIQKAAAAIRPGVTGLEIDTIARDYVVEAGYPEWKHALGHQVGRNAHDGGGVLAPAWNRYRGINDIPVEAGNVFTLELGVATSCGYVGLEEMIYIDKKGATFLSSPQQKIILL